MSTVCCFHVRTSQLWSRRDSTQHSTREPNGGINIFVDGPSYLPASRNNVKVYSFLQSAWLARLSMWADDLLTTGTLSSADCYDMTDSPTWLKGTACSLKDPGLLPSAADIAVGNCARFSVRGCFVFVSKRSDCCRHSLMTQKLSHAVQ